MSEQVTAICKTAHFHPWNEWWLGHNYALQGYFGPGTIWLMWWMNEWWFSLWFCICKAILAGDKFCYESCTWCRIGRVGFFRIDFTMYTLNILTLLCNSLYTFCFSTELMIRYTCLSFLVREAYVIGCYDNEWTPSL